MKKAWSKRWVASTQPRKQRKYRINAPLGVRHRFLSAHLSKELRERFGKRALPVRKSDEVVVMKGSFRGYRGNVERVDLRESKIYIEGVKRKKVDGSEVAMPVDPSNVMITKLSIEDKRRQAVLERSGRTAKPAVKKTEVVKASKKPRKEIPVPKEEHIRKDEEDSAKVSAQHPRKPPAEKEKDW